MVGYLPDEPLFHDYLRAGEIIRFCGEMHGMSASEIQTRMNALVERLSLGDALDDFAVNYSRGMKKKLGLICALLHDPDLLILDEPTNGLDPFATRAFHDLMRETAGRGKTIFFSTHLLDQAERLCTRIAIIARGRLAALGTLADLRMRLASDSSLEDIFFSVASDADTAETQ